MTGNKITDSIDNNNCPSTEEVLAFLNSELNEFANNRIQTHLSDCMLCRVNTSLLSRFNEEMIFTSKEPFGLFLVLDSTDQFEQISANQVETYPNQYLLHLIGFMFTKAEHAYIFQYLEERFDKNCTEIGKELAYLYLMWDALKSVYPTTIAALQKWLKVKMKSLDDLTSDPFSDPPDFFIAIVCEVGAYIYFLSKVKTNSNIQEFLIGSVFFILTILLILVMLFSILLGLILIIPFMLLGFVISLLGYKR